MHTLNPMRAGEGDFYFLLRRTRNSVYLVCTLQLCAEVKPPANIWKINVFVVGVRMKCNGVFQRMRKKWLGGIEEKAIEEIERVEVGTRVATPYVQYF